MKVPPLLAVALLAASVSHAATLPASEDSYGFRAKLTIAATFVSVKRMMTAA